QLLMREGKLKEAEEKLNECLRLRTKLHLANHPQIAETIMVLADLLTEQGQSVKALDLNNKAQKLLKDCQVYA
ncbi:MAG TPA: tetratricopeptide repeat protein, partial [Candidatus Obscuribacter sp.]|nr:tetratricopeptide repeat protein [Candidatus Obscuribacter sp.]